MEEKCPCQTYIKSCCACASMHCDECHGYSKFVQGRFCSNCGRPLKAELLRLYVPKSEVDNWYQLYHSIKEELKQEKIYHRETEKLCDRYCIESQQAKKQVAREIFEEIEFDIHQLMFERDETRAIAIEGIIAELKKKYT